MSDVALLEKDVDALRERIGQVDSAARERDAAIDRQCSSCRSERRENEGELFRKVDALSDRISDTWKVLLVQVVALLGGIVIAVLSYILKH